tara:strand:+ start:240 stop:446 length:207 start_codon:yes stop_codon:yes gene_type:complete
MLSYKLLFFIPLISTLVTYPSGIFLGDRTAQFLSSTLISLAAILSWILFIDFHPLDLLSQSFLSWIGF